MQQRYIEVIGEACHLETASCFRAEVGIDISTAAKKETAIQELNGLVTKVKKSLLDAGLVDEELSEGGLDSHRLWWLRNKQTSRRTILLKVPEAERLYTALAALEPLSTARTSLAITMQQPEFSASGESHTAALRAAYLAAREKAVQLAQEAGGQLGPALSIEEGGAALRGSGFIGDADWWGDAERHIPAFLQKGEGEEPGLQNPARTIWLRCRVKFEIHFA